MKLLLVFFLLFFNFAQAQTLNGVNYETYAGGGSSPQPGQLLTSGVVNNVNFDWGGGAVLDSGRADSVIVRFFGSFRVPGTGLQTFYFAIDSDDGQRLSVNSQLLVDCWCDQGSGFRFNSISLQGGTIVPIDVWYYENGGGAFVNLYWINPLTGNWEIIPNEQLSTDQSVAVSITPTLCCGATSTPFEPSSEFKQRALTFSTNHNGDNRVVVEQIGSGSTISVIQSGSTNNVEIYSYGSNNHITSNQYTQIGSLYNYAELVVSGNNNNISLTQNNEGGSKEVSITADYSNIVNIQQYNNGNHYSEINLVGGNKTVDVTQSGSAAHMTRIELSGGSTGLTLIQQGNTQQFYSITHNCAQTSCAAISVTQGQ